MTNGSRQVPNRIQVSAGDVTVTVEGHFWSGGASTEWEISEAAMGAVVRGLLMHYDLRRSEFDASKDRDRLTVEACRALAEHTTGRPTSFLLGETVARVMRVAELAADEG